MKVFEKILQFKYLIILLFIIVVLSIIRVSYFYQKSIYQEGSIKLNLKVQSIKKKTNKDTVILSGKENLICYYETFPYNVGDIVEIKGELAKIKQNTIPNQFNYAFYLRSRGIYFELTIREMKVISQNKNILNTIREKVSKKINNMNNKAYFYAFILGDTSYFDEEVVDEYQANGLFYLLSIGSLQMMLVIGIVKWLLKKIRCNQKIALIIMCTIIILYILFVKGVIGILRSGICYILKSLCKYFKLKIKYSNIIMLVGSIMLLLRPFYLYEIGFQYSFLISYAISLYQRKLKKNKLYKAFCISLIAFFYSMPITIYHNYEINLLTIFLSLLFAPLFSFVLFPLSIISFIFPNIIPVFNFIVNFIEWLNTLFSNITLFHLIFRKPHIVVTLLYLLILFLSGRYKKYLILFWFMTIIHNNINLFTNERFITFLDVQQGDAIIIKNRNNVYLVDTGGGINYDYANKIIRYVKSLGISKISKLFLTHGDMDHLGSSYQLVSKIPVSTVYFNNNSYNENELNLIKILDNKHINYQKIGKYQYQTSDLKIIVDSFNLESENASSMLMQIKTPYLNLLLMGDGTIKSEEKLLKEYDLKDIDILKVGHHGSKTSTSNQFIKKINPKISIISVGKNNIYHLPNKEVLMRLQNSKVFMTSYDGSIQINLKKNGNILTFPP